MSTRKNQKRGVSETAGQRGECASNVRAQHITGCMLQHVRSGRLYVCSTYIAGVGASA